MTWFVFHNDRKFPLVVGATVTVGRDNTNDVVVSHERVSRLHAMLEINAETGGWQITDQSANGIFGTEGQIKTFTSDQTTTFALGSSRGPRIVISDDPQLNVGAVSGSAAIRQENERSTPPASGSGGKLTMLADITRFGRAEDNNVILQGALASAHHAHVLRTGNTLEVIDLASSRGTYVNGRRIIRQLLSPGDRVSMGGSTFLVTDSGELQPWKQSSGVSLEARNLTVRIGDAVLLQNMSFNLPPRSGLAVVGPSGSGKSTLLGALTGFSPASSGKVLVAERDLYNEYDELRFQIGLVPQTDLVPAQLHVRDALELAAKLRFPADTSDAQRSFRVTEVLDDLSLVERSELRIDKLSGGQRKRVSIALELLTKPALMFLDEPTSGLDPGLDRQVMILLREMADEGRTVVVVTHSVENLALADYLLVLAAGGHTAYFGPPQGAAEYFHVTDIPSVFEALEATSGTEWERRWRTHSANQLKAPQTSASSLDSPGLTGARSLKVSRPQGVWSQFLTLTARNIKVIASDRTYSTLLAVLPLVLALTGALVGNSFGLGPDPATGINPEARSLLLVLVLGSVFTGAATSIQELIKDRVIYRRERAVGLSRWAYIASKALVLGSISAIQGLIFAVLTLAGRSGPGDPLLFPGSLEISAIVVVATVTSCMLGLVLSTFLSSRDAALPTLVILTMVQVVFSGAIPLRFDALQKAIGWLLPGYWEFRSMAASVDLGVLVGPTETSQLWAHTTANFVGGMSVLAIMAAMFVAIAFFALGRHDPGRR